MNKKSPVPLYSPTEQEEFTAVLAIVSSLAPWQRAALQDAMNMIDAGIIKPYPVNVMVTDVRRVIASHRAMHDLNGGLS